MNPRSEAHIALLIDADNSPAAKIDAILTELSSFGVTNVRRAYGNWKKNELKGWEDKLHEHAIRPMQQFDYSKGKNASDMAMVIDALELLYTDQPDAFGIVSSDADFTRLAARIREEGVDVYGFGEQKTPESFRQACTRFIYTENLIAPVPVDAGAKSPVAEAPATKRKPSEAARLIAAIIADMDEDGDGWVAVGGIGNRLRNAHPDFDQRTYGYAKLSDLIRATGRFEVESKGPGGMRIRDRA